MFQRSCTYIGVLAIIFLSACTLFQQDGNGAQPEAAQLSTSSESEPAQFPSTPEVLAPSTITTTNRVLRVWIPPALNATNENETAVLTQQITNYALSQNELDIIIETKVVSGQGGILSYLRTGRNIAPGILPDLIAIPANELSTVFTDELIYPLTGLIDQSAIDAQYPAARTFASVNNVVVGFPFAITDLTHFAYNQDVITNTLNSNWDNLLLDDSLSFAAPLGGNEGGLLVMQFYEAAGGALINEAGNIALQTEPLAFALNKIREGVETNTLNTTISQAASSDEMWDAYLQNRVNLIVTTSEAYLRQGQLGSTAVAPISGINTPLTPVVNGWAWAISTPNSNQQQMAADLINHLTSIEAQSVWSEANQILPANPNALAQWSINRDYLTFIDGQLTLSEAISDNASLQLISLLQEAAIQVISGDASPLAAAEAAAAALPE